MHDPHDQILGFTLIYNDNYICYQNPQVNPLETYSIISTIYLLPVFSVTPTLTVSSNFTLIYSYMM